MDKLTSEELRIIIDAVQARPSDGDLTIKRKSQLLAKLSILLEIALEVGR